MTPRLAAVQVLVALDERRTTLAAEIDRVRERIKDERDRGLLVELTAGTLRWRAQLDALLQQCSQRPLDDLSASVRAILRTAAYQLENLDRVPAHAALNEAVELTRIVGEPRAAGFTNAVLRAFQRNRPRLELPPRPETGADRSAQLAYLSTTLSHPEWLVARWLDRHGFEATEAWCHFNNASPEVTVRSAGRLKAAELLAAFTHAGIDATPARYVVDALQLPAGALGRAPAELASEFLVQDEGSQLVARAVMAAPGQRVLDVCAAPGGKTLLLAADLQQQGQLVAADFRPSRVRLLRRILRHSAPHVPIVALNGTRPLPFGQVFDRVFVDAPCSGLGVIRRDPDLKWTRRPEDLAAMAETQRRLLTNAAEVVAPGGRLVYATCSSEPEENDAIVDAFLAGDARFAPVSISMGPLVRGADALIDAHGCFRTLPFRDSLDAFFAAALGRR